MQSGTCLGRMWLPLIVSCPCAVNGFLYSTRPAVGCTLGFRTLLSGLADNQGFPHLLLVMLVALSSHGVHVNADDSHIPVLSYPPFPGHISLLYFP